MFNKTLDSGQAGDNVGLLLRGVEKEQLERGMVLAQPGTVKPHTEFEAEVYVLTKDEGGRHTPFFNNYRPQFYFRTTDVTGLIELQGGAEMCMPGDNARSRSRYPAHRDGGEAPLRHPRGRAHRRRGRRDQDHQVVDRPRGARATVAASRGPVDGSPALPPQEPTPHGEVRRPRLRVPGVHRDRRAPATAPRSG